MKFITRVALLIWVAYQMLPIPSSPYNGAYQPLTNSLYCPSSALCYHEIAHMMDAEMGYPSRTETYAQTLRFILYSELYGSITPTAGYILYAPGLISYSRSATASSSQEELYAMYYSYHYGDTHTMHTLLQPYYSTDQRYTDLYDCLMRARISLCERALHIEHQRVSR